MVNIKPLQLKRVRHCDPGTSGALAPAARRSQSILVRSNPRELGAEITGQCIHGGAAGAGLGVGVVVRIGVDVIGVDSTVGVGDELDAGDADVVGSKKRFVAALQHWVDVVNDRELRAGLVSLWAGWTKRVADRADIGR